MSISGFLVILGFAGKSVIVADLAIVHGASLALFYTFSANARNVILRDPSEDVIGYLSWSRILLSFPLGFIACWLAIHLSGVDVLLAIIIILRRIVEWVAEIHLSKAETKADYSTALNFIILQLVLFFLASFFGIIHDRIFFIFLLLWAVLPLFISFKFVKYIFRSSPLAGTSWKILLPNLGSTATIGISIYVFRFIIVQIAGKNLAGDLFTAFSVGGFFISFYTNGVGPTAILFPKKSGYIKHYLPVKIAVPSLFVVGTILIVLSDIYHWDISIFDKSTFFWSSVGLSLFGGFIMFFPQHRRLALLHAKGDNHVFGYDLIIHIILLSSIPVAASLLGAEILRFAFLFNAILNMLFYNISNKWSILREKTELEILKPGYTQILISLFLVFPLFFLLDGTIFSTKEVVHSTAGKLSRLPIPISIFACYGGIMIIGNFLAARRSLLLIFLTFVLMLISSIVVVPAASYTLLQKMILMFQFILPIFGLALGEMFDIDEPKKHLFEKTVFFVIFLIVPLQLYETITTPGPILTGNLPFFSIHQHLQYVCTIFCCLFIIALYSLWNHSIFKKLLLILLPLIIIYAYFSRSLTSISLIHLGVFLFLLLRYNKIPMKQTALILIFIVSANIYSLYHAVIYNTLKSKINLIGIYTEGEKKPQMVGNLVERQGAWTYYRDSIVSSKKTFLFGHPEKPDRKIFKSAHNYYLDILYNFGLLSFFPILWLLFELVSTAIRKKRFILHDLPFLGLTLITLFLLFIDNSFTVGLRQPYPGIITFFLFGLLLSRLTRLKVPGSKQNEQTV